MKKLRVIYRISDKGNPKRKLDNADKESCLNNAKREFGEDDIHVIADNCFFNTIKMIESLGLRWESTSLGNIGSFLFALNKVIKEYDSDDYVYFLEDDYLHLPRSKKVLLEGLKTADYVTLYDHPDKYLDSKNGGNPFNHGSFQKSEIFVTESAHWRTINSTTMTFASKVKTIKEDFQILKKQPRKGIPDDFAMFLTLTKQKNLLDCALLGMEKKKAALNILRNIFSFRKKRILISSIPGFATHTEMNYLSPVIKWWNVK